jgi:hypothetical protein
MCGTSVETNARTCHACGESLPYKVDRRVWPWPVRLSLWGLPGRPSAWVCCWLCIAIAALCVLYGFIESRFYIGGIMAFGALPYYYSIRWVDRHSSWS